MTGKRILSDDSFFFSLFPVTFSLLYRIFQKDKEKSPHNRYITIACHHSLTVK